MTRNKFVTPGFSCFNCPSSTAASPSTSSWPTSSRPSVGQRQYSVQSRRYTFQRVHCTLHIAHCALHTAHFTLYTSTAHCTQRTAYCTLHTAQLQSTLQVYCAVVDNWPSSSTPGARYLTCLYLMLHNRITQRCNRQFCVCDCTRNSVSLSPILGYVGNRRIIRPYPAMPLQGKVIVYIVCNIGVYGSHHDPIQHCAAVLPDCK